MRECSPSNWGRTWPGLRNWWGRRTGRGPGMNDPTRLILISVLSVTVGAGGGLLAARAKPSPTVTPQSPPVPPPPTITVWVTKDLFGDQISFSGSPRDDGVIGEHRVPDPAPSE